MSTRMLMMIAIHFLVMTVLMGMGITAVLSAGLGNSQNILLAAIGGFVVALPITWFVVRTMLPKTV